MNARRWAGIVAPILLAAAPARAAEGPAPAGYEDRLIEGGSLAPLPSEAEGTDYDASGLARSWRIEATASRTEQGSTVRDEAGVSASARVDTVKYGALTLDLTLRHNPNGAVGTVWQRGLAFDGGWRADNGAGMLNTPSIELSRQQYRFFLPTFPINGATTEWTRPGGLQLHASAGEPGVFDGLRVAGFSGLGGTVSTVGAHWAPAPGWQAGVQAVDAQGVPGEPGDPSGRTNARSFYAAAAWGDAADRLQLNLLDGNIGAERRKFAAWLDGEARRGRLRHNYGIFRFDPGITWGYSPVSGDLKGVYYRVNFQSQQWIWAGGLDSVASVSGTGGRGLYGTANTRYQVDRSLGVGAGGSMRHSGGDAGSAFAFVDYLGSLGTSRVQLDAVAAQGAQRGGQVTVDQAWATPVGLRMSTSLSVGRLREADGRRATRASIAAFGGIDLTNTLTLEGDVRFSREDGATRIDGRYANIALSWRFAPRWSLNAIFYVNRAELPPFAVIDPLVPIATPAVVPRDRALFVTVRYEDHAGTPVAPLGGAPGSGAGTIVGYVFYDGNDDARRSAGEAGAANVTVLLDGRFSARTDADGRFEFPLVASGAHTVYVMPDNLALPWTVTGEGRRNVAVSTRETARVEIPATRNR